MQKKYKKALIISIVSIIIITLVLILIGLAQVGLNQIALNYNSIMSNYSDTTVYGSGLYWIGLANRFIRINKNQQILGFNNLTTFTTDFYKLSASIQVSILYNFANPTNTSSTTPDFSTVREFYQNFGQKPNEFFYSLIKNEILIILSSHDSSYYQNTNLANIQLESAIEQQIQTILLSWINCTNLVCQGTTTNTQIVDRQIQSLIHDVERATNEKIQLTDYFNTMFAKKQFEILSANTVINLKASELQRILSGIQGSNASFSSTNIMQRIYDNEPINYDSNLLNVLEQLVEIGNRTFPY